MNISAYSFFGQYTLPLIDINKIIENKIDHKSKKRRKKSKSRTIKPPDITI